MTSRLHHALSDLAEQAPAPRTELTGHVITRARRRRRVRLIAVPAVAAGATAAIVVGSTLVGGTSTSAPPAVTVTVPPNGVFNDGPLPGPLPATVVEPIKYTYADGCRQDTDKIMKPITGDCAQWRLVDRSGRQWRFPDAPAATRSSAGPAPVVSPDGRRVVYYRTSDEHYVSRELSSGRITTIRRRMPLRGRAYELMFSGDGRRLSFSPIRPGGTDLLANTTTGAVSEMPRGKQVIGLGRDGSTVVLTASSGERKTLTLAGPDGQVRGTVPLSPQAQLNGIGGDLLSPDGRTLLALPRSGVRNEAVLVDIHTGKLIGKPRLRLPKDVNFLSAILGWAGPTKVVTRSTVPRREGPRTWSERSVIVDLDTGRTETFGTIKLWAYRSGMELGTFSGYAP
ncbi:TolB-like translocation protein [Actinomadura rudentiformis]|uniref:WD40 repeat domain-containing protein n=1 Tax=Actinomadura rudentiformis TaxID=359158 RepID=A0A6H9YHH7_9ACTN|nr:PD40 domain-containing protein [Actinomadura rudentiformis]KAB2341773.1 hypothetical protein F8566_39955 [Actinomadura rudentiformis]